MQQLDPNSNQNLQTVMLLINKEIQETGAQLSDDELEVCRNTAMCMVMMQSKTWDLAKEMEYLTFLEFKQFDIAKLPPKILNSLFTLLRQALMTHS